MRKIYWVIFFLIILFAELIFIYTGNENYRFITKPFLVPVLIAFFILQTKSISHSAKKFVVLALVFSWLGDLLLMFETRSSNFFIFGLIAFLLAHLFYTYYFIKSAEENGVKMKWWLGIPILAYYAVFMFILYPHLAGMLWPVRIYGLVISFMLLTALNFLNIKTKPAGNLITTGASLFVLSDSLLAINKFYISLDHAGIYIMLTYGLAQLLITTGSIHYFNSFSKQ